MAKVRTAYFKDGQRITVGCLTVTVDGLLLSSAYCRAKAWEKAPSHKDLDWLFRPKGHTKAKPYKLPVKPKEKASSPEQDEYIIALKKHMGLRPF